MAETPARKRPVSASRPAPAKRAATSVATKRPAPSVAAKRPAARSARPTRAAAFVEDEAPATNYALRLTEGLDDDDLPVSSHPTRGLRGAGAAKVEEPADDTFARKLSEALSAISAAQVEEPIRAPSEGGKANWLTSLDKLPPIRLPIGPAIPWKIGLPLFVAVIVVMGVMSRSASRIDPPGVQLPAQQTYPVQQESPLFAKPQPTDVPAPEAATAQPETQTQTQPQLGVQDPGGLGFDMVDLGVKLTAVLALAYGSLMVLKKLGVGGASSGRGASASAVRVISSLALAPNRSVHVVEVPGGKTLLIGATPNSVNLLADLSEPSAER